MATGPQAEPPTASGGFRIVKRQRDHYEVYYKAFRSGLMVLVTDGLSKAEAETLKERLNDTLYGYFRELPKLRRPNNGEEADK